MKVEEETTENKSLHFHFKMNSHLVAKFEKIRDFLEKNYTDYIPSSFENKGWDMNQMVMAVITAAGIESLEEIVNNHSNESCN